MSKSTNKYKVGQFVRWYEAAQVDFLFPGVVHKLYRVGSGMCTPVHFLDWRRKREQTTLLFGSDLVCALSAFELVFYDVFQHGKIQSFLVEK